LGPISAFWPITSEDFKPLTQQIGQASRCKAALTACDHCTSSTLIGGKGGAGPSSLHTTLEGPIEYACECKMDVKST
jgi:hypothetical protein